MKELLAVLTVLGGAMTAAGIIRAYRRAKRQKAVLDALQVRNAALSDPTLVDVFEAALSDDGSVSAAINATRADTNQERARLLAEAGIRDGLPTYADEQLPAAYWSTRAALADSLVAFRSDGIVALVGLGLSTVASAWSLYV